MWCYLLLMKGEKGVFVMESKIGMTAVYEQYGISPERIANVVAFAIDQPEDTNVNEFTIGPTRQIW